jgi:hypothetical protein
MSDLFKEHKVGLDEVWKLPAGFELEQPLATAIAREAVRRDAQIRGLMNQLRAYEMIFERAAGKSTPVHERKQ